MLLDVREITSEPLVGKISIAQHTFADTWPQDVYGTLQGHNFVTAALLVRALPFTGLCRCVACAGAYGCLRALLFAFGVAVPRQAGSPSALLGRGPDTGSGRERIVIQFTQTFAEICRIFSA
jgi:hypothetical protein